MPSLDRSYIICFSYLLRSAKRKYIWLHFRSLPRFFQYVTSRVTSRFQVFPFSHRKTAFLFAFLVPSISHFSFTNFIIVFLINPKFSFITKQIIIQFYTGTKAIICAIIYPHICENLWKDFSSIISVIYNRCRHLIW